MLYTFGIVDYYLVVTDSNGREVTNAASKDVGFVISRDGKALHLTSVNTENNTQFPNKEEFLVTELVGGTVDVTRDFLRKNTGFNAASGGSGAVLGSVAEHTDIDLEGNDADSFLRFDGLNFVPYKPFFKIVKSEDFERQNQSTEGLVNQTNTLETYLLLLATVVRSGEYRIDLSAVSSHNVTNDNLIVELVVNDDDGGDEIRIGFSAEESKDSAGNGTVLNTISQGLIVGNVNTGTDVRKALSYSKTFSLVKDVKYVFELQWAGQSNDDEAAIYTGEISINEILK